MLNKEFKDTAKLIFSLMALWVVGMSFYLFRTILAGDEFEFGGIILVFYQLFIFTCSFFFGITLFSKESRNNGFEYLLTLPFSRTRLLLLKITPRFAILTILYLIYLLIMLLSKSDPFLFPPATFTSLVFSFFFISTSLSVLRGNFVGNSIITLFLFLFFLVASNLVAWLVTIQHFGNTEGFKLRAFAVPDTFPFNPLGIVLLGLLVSSPFMISLFYGFKKFDIRAPKIYFKRFLQSIIPLMIIGMIISYFILNLSISVT